MEINLDRAPTKMPPPPQRDNCAFAVITKSQLHAIFDARIGAGAQGCLQNYQAMLTMEPATGRIANGLVWITAEAR
jgi:hypothetical protein